METVRWDEFISDERRDNETHSDIEFKKQRDQISKDAKKKLQRRPRLKILYNTTSKCWTTCDQKKSIVDTRVS